MCQAARVSAGVSYPCVPRGDGSSARPHPPLCRCVSQQLCLHQLKAGRKSVMSCLASGWLERRGDSFYCGNSKPLNVPPKIVSAFRESVTKTEAKIRIWVLTVPGLVEMNLEVCFYTECLVTGNQFLLPAPPP